MIKKNSLFFVFLIFYTNGQALHHDNQQPMPVKQTLPTASPHMQHTTPMTPIKSSATSMQHGMIKHKMHGMYGNYPMNRDATGTAWMPDSTIMPGIHRMYNEWLTMMHGYTMVIWDQQGGKRGSRMFFSENMGMITTQKTFGHNTIALRSMFSLEPGTIGKKGYPLLLQTGETANGITPLIDRQHPHDFLMELAAVYTRAWSEKDSFFLYFGMPGEPAIGPPAFIHRFSAFYNPEAPITHHWFDSTHIVFGVLTAGYVHDWFKIDASIFTGREPNQHRWDFDKPRFDSYCIRLSANKTENVATQISYGFLKGPEQVEPTVNTHRMNMTCSYNKAWNRNNWQTTFGLSINKDVPGHTLPSALLESALELQGRHIFFGRTEWVAKDELFIPPEPRAHDAFGVGKIDAGYLYMFLLQSLFRCGIGFVGSVSFVTHALKDVYGGYPFSYMIFARIDLKEF